MLTGFNTCTKFMKKTDSMKTHINKDRSGSRISGKGVHVYKGTCVWEGFRFADFISLFLNIPCK